MNRYSSTPVVWTGRTRHAIAQPAPKVVDPRIGGERHNGYITRCGEHIRPDFGDEMRVSRIERTNCPRCKRAMVAA